MLAQRYEFYVQVAKTISISLTLLTREILFLPQEHKMQARRRGGGGGGGGGRGVRGVRTNPLWRPIMED